jgi:hypothetical protein
MKISIDKTIYEQDSFSSEQELEEAVQKHAEDIFSNDSVYVCIKRKVTNKNNNFINIPDAYVIDFRGRPKLWVVENELSTHDSFRHIGVQMLQFASQFTEGSFEIKSMLLKAINNNKDLLDKAKKLTKKINFQNIGEVLDYAIYKNEFGFVIIIDEINQDLYSVTRELARQPELLQIQKYRAKDGTLLYTYEELLGEVVEAKSPWIKDIDDIDTMVAPAKEEGFKRVFLGQKEWYAVRIASSVIPRLKYLAMYEVSPVSAIRWVGKIESIQPYEDTGKYRIYLSEINKIEPIKLGNPQYTPYGPRYTTYELLQKAKDLGDL